MNTNKINLDDFDAESQRFFQGMQFLDFEQFQNNSIDNGNLNNFTKNNVVVKTDYISTFAKTFEFKNLSSKDITENYFNGIKPVVYKNSTIVQEPETKVDLQIKEMTIYYEANGQKGYQIGKDELLYKIHIYISTSQSKLEDLYVKSEKDIKSNEILLFLEDNTGDESEQYLFARFGNKVDKELLLKSNGLDTLTSLVPDFDIDSLKELIQTGQVKAKTTITSAITKGIMYVLSIVGLPGKAIGWLCDEIGDIISKYLSVPETVWNSKSPDYFLNKKAVLKDLTIDPAFLKTIPAFLINQNNFTLLTGFLPVGKPNELVSNQVVNIESLISNYNAFVTKILTDIYDGKEDSKIAFYIENISEQIAFMCGIWNGLIDFIAGIFKFLGLLLSSLYQIGNKYNEILVTLDELWENIKNTNFTDVLIAALTVQFEITDEIYRFFTSKNPREEYNFDKIAYFIGFGLAFVATLFIPLADLTKISGITKLKSLIPEEFITALAKVKGKTINSLQELLTLVREMSEVLAKGFNEILSFFRKIKDDIVKWFKRNLKEFERKLILVNDATEFIKRYTLTTAQHINFGEVRIQVINPKLPKNDPKRIIEEYSYTPKRGKTGKSKAQYKATVGGMHNLNNLNRYVRLKGELELAGKLPTGEKVYKGLVEFYVKELKQWSKAKPSTFFPKKWSEEKIKKVIEEASMNIVKKKGNKYIGLSKDKIQIEMWVNEKTKEIETAYITFEKIN